MRFSAFLVSKSGENLSDFGVLWLETCANQIKKKAPN